MDTLNIAFVTPEYVTEKYFDGGLANYLHRFAKALVALGHKVYVITLSEIDAATFEHQGVQIYRVLSSNLYHRLNRITRYRICTTAKWIDFNIQAYKRLRSLHQNTPIDIVQFPSYSACGIVSALLLSSIPRVVRISSYRPVWHSLSGASRTLDLRLLEWLEWLQLRLNRNIYAPSYALQKILAEALGLQHVKVIRTPFYVETDNWDASMYETMLQSKPYLLFFGRFQLNKGFHILAQALPKFLAHCPDAYSVFVGQDFGSALAPSMKEYAQSCCPGNAERLIFMPQLPHQQLYPIINHSRFVVLPSLMDNLPNACLEAMGLGKPVIGTIGTSLDELITDGETGFLVPPNDADALADKMIEAWTHVDLGTIGQAARRKIDEFSPQVVVPLLLNYYRNL